MRIVLVGFGSVGRALASLLESRRDELYARMGLSPKLVCVMDSQGAAVSQSAPFRQHGGADRWRPEGQAG